MRRLLVGASRRAARDLQNDLFAHVEHLPARFFDTNRTGDLIARLTSDIEAVRFPFGPGLMYVAGTVVLFPTATLPAIPMTYGTDSRADPRKVSVTELSPCVAAMWRFSRRESGR